MPATPISLNQRLLWSAAIVLAVFLCLTAIVLERAFVSSLTRAQAERLQSNILLLLSAAESSNEGLQFPDMLEEPRFNQPGSGLYGFVFGIDGSAVWQTPSTLLFERRSVLENHRQVDVGNRDFSIVLDKAGDNWLLASLGVAWESDEWHNEDWGGIEAEASPAPVNLEQPPEDASQRIAISRLPTSYTFLVLETASAFQQDIRDYRTNLWGWLLAVGLLLLTLQLLLLRWGLLPLRRFAKDVQALEQGTRGQLQENYPRELGPLAQNLNELLEHEQKQRDRYKGKLADLAHSLKTPLSVVQGELSDDSAESIAIREQLQRMDDIIQYQLQRASAVAPKAGGQWVDVAKVLDKLLAALRKVYADKDLRFDVDCDAAARFRGDESDLMEIMGNLLDNACKYSNSKVRVVVHMARSAAQIPTVRPACVIRVEDDGPGVAESDRERILQRGQRLDTLQPGQGIGLSVVEDIVQEYGAQLELSDSALGGACFELRFN